MKLAIGPVHYGEMTEAPVLYNSNNGVGVITLNRPDNRNSMTSDLLDAFAQAANQAGRDTTNRVVIITGRGDCFCAGADFKSQVQRKTEVPRMPHEQSYAMYESFLRVLDIEVPTIAAMNGHAVGGGFGLALLCDIRIAADKAFYGANFSRVGFHSGLGISYVLPRLVGVSLAAELLFTGRLVDGNEAKQIGLASRVCAPEKVMPEAQRLANDIAQRAPIAVRMMKRSLYRHLSWNVHEAAMDEAYAQAATLNTEDAAEGMQALLEKRHPNFRGR